MWQGVENPIYKNSFQGGRKHGQEGGKLEPQEVVSTSNRCWLLVGGGQVGCELPLQHSFGLAGQSMQVGAPGGLLGTVEVSRGCRP